ncbi:hypothetical protein BUALT_Bualt14G0111700 [Buddleja alternifolia]|uniref:Uncharacterized protein n=1 Tax=Buddleja alternifolia TaxID=168488 RepID=A0AAV6WQ67_9LAMI|nr:hypothetical protein BUALT_Bualt14G0111700 [Buddleja alternifolia]
MENEDHDHEMSPFCLLPEGCISNIISLTSAGDACTAAAVSLRFKSAADSDTVWERFLPPDYKNIIARCSSPVAYSTKKKLYFMLCDSHLLLDEGKMSIRLNKSTGKKWYMLSARELQIAWKDNPIYWKWTSLPESRFAEVAELLSVSWLEISGKFQAQTLSPETKYAAYLVFKLSENHSGLNCSSKTSVKFVKENSTETTEEKISSVYLDLPTYEGVMRRRRWMHMLVRRMGRRLAWRRNDDWLEVELGQFFINDEGDKNAVQIKLFETELLDWKKGLIVEGIEVRPVEASDPFSLWFL